MELVFCGAGGSDADGWTLSFPAEVYFPRIWWITPPTTNFVF
jgi:hypothetical protein